MKCSCTWNFCGLAAKSARQRLQIVRYTTEDRLNEIIRYHEDKGAFDR